MKKFLLYFLSILLLFLVVGILYFRSVAILEPPHPKSLAALNLKRTKVDTDFYTLGNSWIKKAIAACGKCMWRVAMLLKEALLTENWRKI